MADYKIAPSILSADFAKLGEEVRAVEGAGSDYCHFDVMDNHYVPNLTIGPMVAEALKPVTNMTLDCHLMIEPVDPIVPEFAKAGADIITFHPEASRHPHRTVQLIKDQGCKAGISLNPGTPLEWLDYLLEEIDLVLVMSVNPGFGGQAFIESSMDKIRAIRDRIDDAGLTIELEVDGGIKADNVARVAEAGADVFVSGSGVFKADDYGARLQEFRDALGKVER
ncbi:ribulose-phosphate 3-epimerase [Thiohalorhabdus sp.]|uniref:ribulose-phosphate 3-epimerase n=1 Tax=Thiohalorhabdus sp. TaxID=3094134 RepID=UPI002FC28CE9